MWYRSIPYVLLFLSCLILLIYICIKLSYGFWYYQPVFHLYDFWYYFFPCGIIQHHLPEVNKYTNLNEIETVTFTDEFVKSKHRVDDFMNLVQINYLQNGENVFSPKEDNVIPYFIGHVGPCFFSFFTKPQLLLENNKTQTNKENKENAPSPPNFVQGKKVIAAMTTRPLHVMIKNRDGSTWNSFDVYYVDYLCVDYGNRKKGTAQQVIQTHHYNQRRNNTKILVSLFKREGRLTGIVPLCVYTTFGFSMESWSRSAEDAVPSAFKVVACGGYNARFLLDFMKETRVFFDICISPELSNVLELVKTGNLYLYFLLDSANNDVMAAYFFRKTCTYMTKGRECLQCFGSICKTQDALFMQGFHEALAMTVNHDGKTRFHYLSVENISHNDKILAALAQVKRYKYELESPTAYFFYNFAYSTFNPNKVLIIS
jgi:hypothetical protein